MRFRPGRLQRAILNVLTEPMSVDNLVEAVESIGVGTTHRAILDSAESLARRGFVYCRPGVGAATHHRVYRLTHRGHRVAGY